MESTLGIMWYKYNLLICFKQEMNKKGYCAKELIILDSKIELLIDLIETESFNVLSDLLRKTYYRILKRIEKGSEYLHQIVKHPDQWILNPIENDLEAWKSKDVLIFSTKDNCAVFSHINRRVKGSSYIDNKWQIR